MEREYITSPYIGNAGLISGQEVGYPRLCAFAMTIKFTPFPPENLWHTNLFSGLGT